MDVARDTRARALLVLSGGLDSTVAAFLAADTHEIVLALTFDYGQRAARRELAASYGVAAHLGVRHRTVFLPFFREFARGALVDPAAALPTPAAEDLDDAEAVDADVLIVGFNAEEAATFPDNSAAFVERLNAALELSTANGVEIVAPTAAMTKAEIVRLARERDLPLELVWSCYEGDDVPCGACESCRRFARALEAAGAQEWFAGRRAGGGIG